MNAKNTLFVGTLAMILGCGDIPQNNNNINNSNSNKNSNQNMNSNQNDNNHNNGEYHVIDVQHPGTLHGKVIYALEAPEQRYVSTSDSACPHQVFHELLVVGKDKGLKNAVISLDNVVEGKTAVLVYDVVNAQCAYVPHVLVAMKNAKVTFTNTDDTLHNIHGGNINAALPWKGAKTTNVFHNPGFYPMKCDVHPWMKGYVIVKENPYFVVSDEHGSFIIDTIPSGTYELSVWHESLGKKKMTVSVEADKVTTIAITYL